MGVTRGDHPAYPGRVQPGSLEQVERLLAGPRPVPLVHAGDPVLRRPTLPYDGELPGELLVALIEVMRETMTAAPGVGLAAPQIGLGLRLAVVEDRHPVDPDIERVRDRHPVLFRVLVNPEYEPVDDRRAVFYEGCLSVPGYQAVVERAAAVRLTGDDADGHALDEVVSGWAARIVAHETDHLDGRLYLDRARTRSLTTTDNYLRYWAAPTVDAARAELDF